MAAGGDSVVVAGPCRWAAIIESLPHSGCGALLQLARGLVCSSAILTRLVHGSHSGMQLMLMMFISHSGWLALPVVMIVTTVVIGIVISMMMLLLVVVMVVVVMMMMVLLVLSAVTMMTMMMVVAVAVVVAVVVMTTMLAVKVLGRPNSGESKVGEPPTDLGHDSPSTCRVAHPAVALSVRTAGLRRNQVGPHGFHETDSLRVSRHGQGPLNDIIPKRVTHNLTDTLRVAQFLNVQLLDPVGASLEAFLHNVRAELLDSQQTDFSNDALTDRVDVFVSTDVQDVLDDVVSVGILHEWDGTLHNAAYQVCPGLARRRVETPLNDTTSMAVPGYVPNTGSNGVKDKLRVLRAKFQQDTLDDVVAVTVNAQPCGGWCQCADQNVGSCGTTRVVVTARSGFIDGTQLDNLLHTSSTVQIQASVDQARTDALH